MDRDVLLGMERTATEDLFAELKDLGTLVDELENEYNKLGWLRADNDLGYHINMITHLQKTISVLRRVMDKFGFVDFDERDDQYNELFPGEELSD